mmetsp:Transcript_25469/g.22479  ORF Transcript_25469/g.22479 Transcript_25469/m.22479 type:complete len:190 (+) Transcript_25469:363-932(+)
MFLMSKSSQKEKASALFDLYDVNFNNMLSKIEADNAICKICQVVFIASEKVLDHHDESMISLHEDIMQKKRDEKVPKMLKLFFEDKKELSRENFMKMLELSAKSDDMIDFTDPASIREHLMDFLFKEKKLSQGQLQMMYGIRSTNRSGTFFLENADGYKTNDTTPRASELTSNVKFQKENIENSPTQLN